MFLIYTLIVRPSGRKIYGQIVHSDNRRREGERKKGREIEKGRGVMDKDRWEGDREKEGEKDWTKVDKERNIAF